MLVILKPKQLAGQGGIHLGKTSDPQNIIRNLMVGFDHVKTTIQSRVSPSQCQTEMNANTAHDNLEEPNQLPEQGDRTSFKELTNKSEDENQEHQQHNSMSRYARLSADIKAEYPDKQWISYQEKKATALNIGNFDEPNQADGKGL